MPVGTGGQTVTDYVRTPVSGNGIPGMSILSADFTLEYWFFNVGNGQGNQPAAGTYVPRSRVHYDSRTLAANATGFALAVTEHGLLIFYTNSLIAINGYVSCLPNTWNHVALVRVRGTITLYQNGQSMGSIFNNTVFFDNQTIIGISYADGVNAMDGYIDEFRITKLARYTSSFTPPYRIKGK